MLLLPWVIHPLHVLVRMPQFWCHMQQSTGFMDDYFPTYVLMILGGIFILQATNMTLW